MGATKRIKQITVTGLFGMFNHVIPLHMDERITIIRGPNGFGKTTIFRLLNALFRRNYSALRKIPFDELRIEFDNNIYLRVVKEVLPSQAQPTLFPTQLNENKPQEHGITFYSNNENPFSLPFSSSLPTEQLEIISRVIPSLRRVSATIWRNRMTEENLKLEDIIDRFGDRLPPLRQSKEPEWLSNIISFVSIRFIETQRLLNTRKMDVEQLGLFESERQISTSSTVSVHAKDLASEIEKKTAEYATKDQSLSKTFPARAIRPDNTQNITVSDELRTRFANLEKKRTRFMLDGLLDQNNNEAFQIDDQIDSLDDIRKIMLSVYVEDTESKLGVFDEIADRIDLLKGIINKRFLYKRMETTKKEGFVFTLDNGTDLALEDLSSGEQHELVLFYELLFKTAPGSLVLIDEPEISLHIVWQEHFLKDVQEVTRLSNIDVIVATHSPDVINGHRDLLVELEGPK